MKKLIAILVVFAVITGVAFAQMAGGMFANAWGQGVFSPLMIQTAPINAGEKVKDVYGKDLGARTFVGMGPDWGWSSEFGGGITVGAWSEGIGFSIGLEPTGNEIYGNIWAKPFNGHDGLKITIGNYTDDTLRGKVSPGGRSGGFVLPGFDVGEDYIFSRLGNDTDDGCYTPIGGSGFLFTSAPVDGLFLGWNVNVGTTFHPNPENGANRRANDAFRGSQVAIGYNIPNIGLVRAMYLGGWAGKLDLENEKTQDKLTKALFAPDYENGTFGDTDEQTSLQVAFNITAIEGINIDIGYRVFFPITVWYDYDEEGTLFSNEKHYRFSQGHWLSAGINMNFGIFNMTIFATGKFGAYNYRTVNKDTLDYYGIKRDKTRDGLELQVKLDPSLSLDFGTIGLSLAYKFKGSPIVAHVDSNDKVTKFARDKDNPAYTHQIGMGLWYERSLGSGQFTIALTYTMPELRPTFNNEGKYDKARSFGSHWIQLPITLTYAFF